MMEDPKPQVRVFLKRFLRNYEIQDDEDIFSLGFVNSMLALQLVQFIEKQFDVEIDDDDLELDNFRTLVAMETLIRRKVAEG